MSEQLPISDRSVEGQGLPGKSEKLQATIDDLNTRKDQLEAVLAEGRRELEAKFNKKFKGEREQLGKIKEAL